MRHKTLCWPPQATSILIRWWTAEQLTRDWRPANLPAPAADDLSTVPEGIVLEPELSIPDASQVYLVRIADGLPSMTTIVMPRDCWR